jgi:hypothetical protein
MLKYLFTLNLLIFIFQISFGEENKSLQLILMEAKEKNIDINDKVYLKNLESAFSLYWQSKNGSDAEKFQISFEILMLLQPFMKNENNIEKIEALRNLVLSNLRVASNEKKLDATIVNKLISIIGSNEYKCLFINKAKIGTYVHIKFVEPAIKAKELSNQNEIEMGELSQLSNEIDFYLFDREKTLENKLILILATYELSNKVNEIIKNEVDIKRKGWYTVINESMRENSLKYLIEFRSDVEKSKVVEKYMPEISKFLLESELKTIQKIVAK